MSSENSRHSMGRAICLGIPSSSFFVDVFTDNCELSLHDIPRRGRARTLSRDIAHASQNEQLQAAVRGVKYED